MSVVWARVVVGGRDTGAGIVLAARSLLTAARCVPGIEVHDPAADLLVSIDGAMPIPALLTERVDDADLALLRISDSAGPVPLAIRGRPGDRWQAPASARAGRIVSRDDGVLGLGIDQPADSPGAPVIGDDDRLVGMFVGPDPAKDQRNALIAATIDDVMDRFTSLRSAHLLRSLIGEPAPQPADLIGKPRDVSAAWAILRLLDNQGVIDPEVRAIHQVLAGKWAAEHAAAQVGNPDEPRSALS